MVFDNYYKFQMLAYLILYQISIKQKKNFIFRTNCAIFTQQVIWKLILSYSICTSADVSLFVSTYYVQLTYFPHIHAF